MGPRDSDDDWGAPETGHPRTATAARGVGPTAKPSTNRHRDIVRAFQAGTTDAVNATDIRSSLDALGALVGVIRNQLDELAEEGPDTAVDDLQADTKVLRRRRRKLLEMLVGPVPASVEQLREAATAARWPLPQRLAVVVLAAPPVGSQPFFSPEILTDFDRPMPVLVVPDPTSPSQVRAVTNGLGRCRAAVGTVVEPTAAGASMRWACQALDLLHQGIIRSDGIVWCSEHLSTIAIFQDPDLVTALANRVLTPLSRLRDAQREPLSETLLAWLQLNMSANEVAAKLHVHPQTVRHRLRHLARLFGDSLRDPEMRFDLEIALRADQARRHLLSRQSA